MTAPPGNRLILNFSEALTSPAGDAVELSFSSTTPPLNSVGAGDTSLFGKTGIGYLSQYAWPVGFDSMAFHPWPIRPPSVDRHAQRINTTGWDSGAVESPTYVRWRRFIQPPGTFEYGYKIEQVPIPRTRYLGGYMPAPGSAIVLNFSEDMAPPPGASITLEFGAVGYGRVLGATVGDSLEFGDHLLTRQRSLRPEGFTATIFGTQRLESSIRYVSLSTGIPVPTNQVGNPVVTKKAAALLTYGFTQMAAGTPTIGYREKVVQFPGFLASEIGTQRVEFAIRNVIQIGWTHETFGTSWVSYLTREVAPPSIFSEFASAHVVGGTRYLSPIGFDASEFGARIIPESQTAYPLGFSGEFGLQDVKNNLSLVNPVGFATFSQPEFRWGRAAIWNLRQYITQEYDPDSELNAPPWPLWTLIENRNRHVATFGQDASRVASPSVSNNARVALPSGIAPPAVANLNMVAYRQRYYGLDGIEPPYFSGWSNVRNGARLLSPPGYVASSFGTHRAANNRRYFNYIGGFDSALVGQPMISDRIRTLSFESRYSIEPPPIHAPVVDLYTRYIEPRGLDRSSVGGHDLVIHFNTLAPKWTHQNLFGDQVVRNVTPELRAYGHNSEEFGDSKLRLQWRGITTLEAFTQAFGNTIIADRTRRITVNGIRSMVVGDKLVVTKTGAPPYSQQIISLNDEDGSGFGIDAPYQQVPVPILNQQVLYVHQDESNTRFGAPRVTANSIRVEPGYGSLGVGEPSIGVRVRTIAVHAFTEVFYPSPAAISPHTIWAVVEAPQQAVRNHPNHELHYVDGRNKPPGAIFGNATVTLQHRVVNAPGISPGIQFGSGLVWSSKQYVLPNGFGSMRFGWHTFPAVQEVAQFDSAHSMAIGLPAVSRPPYVGPQTVLAAGLNAQAFGGSNIDLFNREILASGFAATHMGQSNGGDTPYAWQSLNVGPRMPTIPQGFNAHVFGVTWISARVREIRVEGFDHFACEYDIEQFDRRMKVRRITGQRPALSVTPVGILAFESSASDVKLAVQYIRPDGNSDQYRKGAF